MNAISRRIQDTFLATLILHDRSILQLTVVADSVIIFVAYLASQREVYNQLM